MRRIIIPLIIVLVVASITAVTLILLYPRYTATPQQAILTPVVSELGRICNNSESSLVVIYHTTKPNTQLFNILSNSIASAIASSTSGHINTSFNLCVISYSDLSSELRGRLTSYHVFPIFGVYSTSADLSRAELIKEYFDNIEGFYISKFSSTIAIYTHLYNYYRIPVLSNTDIYLETTKMPRLDVDEMPVIGSTGAGIYVFMYEDILCQYCAKFYIEVLPALEKHIENSTLALVLKNLVIHQEARDIHRYLMAVYMESRNSTHIHTLLTKIYERVYRNIHPSIEEVLQMIESVYGRVPSLNRYKVDEVIMKDLREAQNEYGIYATPSFILWSRERGVGAIVIGYRSAEAFLNIISYIS